MELIVKLKQHTPIIHFQWDQEGATLRATELKPKLDKYIKQIDKYYPADVLDQLNKMAEGNNVYSLKVIGSTLKEKIIPKVLDKRTKLSGEYDIVEHVSNLEKDRQKIKRSLYFGDIKAMLEYDDDIVLKFQSFDKKMLAKVLLALPIMLALENFGSRQNKGFGSFYIDDTPTFSEFPNLKGLYNIEEIYKRYASNSQNNIYILEAKTNDYIEVFKIIYYFYNALKSGINDGTIYYKSLLWKYMRKNYPNLVWEKRAMKQTLIGDPIPIDLPSPEYQYIRVLLGMSPVYEFRPKNNVRMDSDYFDKRKLSIRSNKKFIVKNNPANNEDNIERSLSPITFKPINTQNGYKIYIILKKELISNIMGKTFSFRLVDNTREFNIKSPVSFDLNEFMDFAIQEMSKDNLAYFANRLKIKKL